MQPHQQHLHLLFETFSRLTRLSPLPTLISARQLGPSPDLAPQLHLAFVSLSFSREGRKAEASFAS